MNKHRLLGVCLLFLIVAFIFIQPAYAGPGSGIAKAIITTIWGLIFYVGLTVVSLPLAIYEFINGKIDEQRPLKDLV